jgi:hypothetical protein
LPFPPIACGKRFALPEARAHLHEQRTAARPARRAVTMRKEPLVFIGIGTLVLVLLIVLLVMALRRGRTV